VKPPNKRDTEQLTTVPEKNGAQNSAMSLLARKQVVRRHSFPIGIKLTVAASNARLTPVF
jgi:hypothetical protein